MFFNNIKPRRFNHRPIYSDERKERLKAIEERARRQLGIPTSNDNNARQPTRDLHGAFATPSSRRRRTASERRGTNPVVLIIMIAVLSALMFWLLTGGTIF